MPSADLYIRSTLLSTSFVAPCVPGLNQIHRGGTLLEVAPDSTAPVISSPSPSSGSSIAANATVGMDVTDDSGSLGQVLIYATFPGASAPELVYDGSAFSSAYSSGSTVTSITNGLRFRLVRAGVGFYGTFTVTTLARDPTGNAASQTYTWTAPAYPTDSTAPTATATPASGSTVTQLQAIQIDVTDDSGALASVWVSATIQGVVAPEVVHDGTSFSAPYAAGSTRTSITGGYRFNILRDGGWAGPFTLKAYAKDSAGNELA
jgi:hypothetical protein